ncbi:hypothetical protein E9993_08630 [Labilibacter sediminis]|nr:hypothetical protein E9993_08630 [Labilibacter sediminis]
MSLKDLTNIKMATSLLIIIFFSSCSKDDNNDSGLGSIILPEKGETGIFIDNRDGKTYKWVKIGDQVWMAENLAYKGKDIQYIPVGGRWFDNNECDGWCYYEDNPAYGTTYGVLYQWEAAKKSSPPGWHLPTIKEWRQLENYLKENGYSCDGILGGENIAKSLTKDGNWKISEEERAVGNDDFPEYRDITGFSALPGGYRHDYGIGGIHFYFKNISAHWWSATVKFRTEVYTCYLNYNESDLLFFSRQNETGCYVRCIKD